MHIFARLPNSNMLGHRAASEDYHSQDEHREPRKRRRKALSCFDCKRRKLKCDRAYPACGRCVKAGIASQCSYDSYPAESANNESLDNTLDQYSGLASTSTRPLSPQTPFNSLSHAGSVGLAAVGSHSNQAQSHQTRIRQLEEQLASLENRPKNLSNNVRAVPTSSHGTALGLLESRDKFSGIAKPTKSSNTEVPEEAMVFRGKRFRTQFYGASHPGSLHIYVSNMLSYIL